MSAIILSALLFISKSFSLSSTLVSYTAPGNIEPGRTATVSVVMKNNGPETWLPTTHKLCSTRPNLNTRWGLSCKSFQTSSVPPGSSVTFTISARAPATLGSYDMGWRMYKSSSPFGQEAYKIVTVQNLPAQFIAKLYTEALGRAPDPGGWQAWLDFFRNGGCTLAKLVEAGNYFFQLAEFNNLSYDNESRIIALYRAALSRDPDQSGFNTFVGQLNGGTPFATVVNTIFSSSEFSGLQALIFNGGSYGWLQAVSASYLPTPDLTADAACNEIVNSVSGANLQAALNRAPIGTRVCLGRKAIIPLTATLVIPAGVTLTTRGLAALGHTQYASFGRLIRANNAPTLNRGYGLVEFRSGSGMENVWIDGQESWVGRRNQSEHSLRIVGFTDDVAIQECKVAATPGGTNLEIGEEATNVWVINNVITSYTSRHWVNLPDTWTDGITCGGPSSVIIGNHIIDATDVGIVMFGFSSHTQASLISGNTVLNAGNSTYAGLAVEQWQVSDGSIKNFTGGIIQNNTIWTGPNVHMDIAICIGSRPWWDVRTFQGTGITVRGNTSSGRTVNCNVGIAVNNMNNATVQNNVLSTVRTNTTGLPLNNVIVQTNNVWPTTNIQPFTAITNDALMDARVFHSQ